MAQRAPLTPLSHSVGAQPLIALDARDAFLPVPHGSGLYVRRLLEALPAALPPHWRLDLLGTGHPGPEVLWEQVGLPRHLHRSGAALVHGPDSFLPLRRPCPGVLTVHDLVFEAIAEDMAPRTAAKYRWLVPRSARSAERVICPSQFTAGDLEQRYGVSPERLRVIPEAPALPLGDLEPPPGPYILAAGALRPKKNLGVLVQAFARLHREGLPHRLVLAGPDGGSAEQLHRLAGATPVEQTGFVTDEELDALLRGADALVVPSLYEGFGLVVLDAMQRGCPVVLARAGALPDTGGDAALYFDPNEIADLAGVLRELLSDSGARARLAEAGRARAQAFSWQATAQATVAVYRELLE